MTSREFLRIATWTTIAGALSMFPSVLNAACDKKEYPSTQGWTVEITCCGEYACCTTKWHGNDLAEQSCT